DALDALRADTVRATRLRTTLKSVPDLTRALTRLALGRGGSRDLNAMGRAIRGAGDLASQLQTLATPPAELARLATTLGTAPLALADTLAQALDDEPPLMSRDGGFTRKGYDAALDAERALASETRTVVAALQA